MVFDGQQGRTRFFEMYTARMRHFSVLAAAALLAVLDRFPPISAGACAGGRLRKTGARRQSRNDHRQHHARAGPGRLSALRPPLVRRLAEAVFRLAQTTAKTRASTYVVNRDGSGLRKLSEAEAKQAPPAGGRWDKARKRLLFNDGGDIVIYDAATGQRRQITKTSGGEGNPRWARNDTHVTYVSGGNLFIMAVDGSGPLVTQLMESAPRRPEPRLTDSQKFITEEEKKLIEDVRRRAEERKKREDRARAERLPQFELAGPQQSAVDLMLSPDETHVFIAVAERVQGAKTTIVPNYVTESGYTEDIPARTNVGDTQDRRLLAILNLKTGKTVWADGSFAPPVSEAEKPAGRRRNRTRRQAGPGRRARDPLVDARRVRRRQAGGGERALGRQQGSLVRDARPGNRQDEGHRHAARRGVDPRAWASADRASSSCPTAAPRGSSPSATAGCTSTRSTSAATAPSRSS